MTLDATRTIAPASSDLQPAEATATLSELEMPIANLIRDTAYPVVEALGLEQKANESKCGDAMRWTGSPKGENAGCSRVNHFVPRT